MNTYVLDQGRQTPGGGAECFNVMPVCPSGSAGIAVKGNATRYDIGTVVGLALIPAFIPV